MKIRSKRPHLFSDAIPLSDDEIKESEVYKQLLSIENSGADAIMSANNAGINYASKLAQMEQDIASMTNSNKVKISNFWSEFATVRQL